MARKKHTLALEFLGGIHIGLNGAAVTGFATKKALALFVYLAVTRQPHTRDHLDTLLWSNLDDAAARRALRYALWNLRQILGPFIAVTPQNITFKPAPGLVSDLEEFLTCAQPPVGHGPPSDRDIQDLERAVELYRGEFLRGLHVRDADEFDAWMVATRERLHLSALDALKRLVIYGSERQDYARGIDHARRLVELEPWNETGHRALIQFYVSSGDPGAARAQYETCRRILAAELNAEPDDETHELVGRLLPDLIEQRNAEPTAPPPRHNLPNASTPFYGRTSEITRIVEKMRDPTCRLLTLTGEGGIGKTRLAVEAARQLVEDFSDGAWFVRLAGVEGNRKNLGDVLAAATAKAVHLYAGQSTDLGDQLRDFLRGRQCLLLLDNFEQFLEPQELSGAGDQPMRQNREQVSGGAAWVRDLIGDGPGVRLLVTSRGRLNLQAEYVIRLGGLDVPEVVTDDAAQEYSGVRLFIERAERAGVRADELQISEIVRFCQMVEGLPLAIELAAAQMNHVPLAELSRVLQNNLDVITTTQRDVPEQHRSLRAVFENSWRLLDSTEQHVLIQAAIFQVGFTREAAEQVIEDSRPRAASKSGTAGIRARVSKAMGTLVDKSLVRWNPATGRFRLHPLIRQFALEKARPQQKNRAHERHTAYFLDFAAARAPRLFGKETRAALAEIQNELAEIRSAWEWGIQHLHRANLTGALDALEAFYEYSGLSSEGLALLEDTLRVLERKPRGSRTFRLRLELAYGKSLVQRHRHVDAENLMIRVLAQAEQSHARGPEAWSHYVYALAVAHVPDTEREIAELERARTLANLIQDTRLEALSLLRLGMVSMRVGQYPIAKENTRKALREFESLQDIRHAGGCLAMLGLVYHTLGEFPEAIAAQTRAIEIADLIGSLYLKAVTLHNLGNTLASQGEYERALDCMEQSEQCHRDAGSRLVVGSQAQRGVFLALLGKWVQSRTVLHEITHVIDPEGAHREYGWANRGLALLARRRSQLADAVRFSRLALESARHWDDSIDQAEAAILLADALFESGVLDEAEEQYRLVLSLREKMFQPHLEPEAMAGLSHIALARGDMESAREWIYAIWKDDSLRLAPGPDEPFWVYWTGYEVMRALNDPRAARLLETAQMVLAEYASLIRDPYTRDQFLQVPWHRAILDTDKNSPYSNFIVVPHTVESSY